VSSNIESSGSRRPYTVQELFPSGVHRARPLSAWTECRVAELARAGNERAVELLVRANMPFVVFIARSLERPGIPIGDLVCAGNEGLYRAVKKFDPERGYKLISFAVLDIRRAIWGSINKSKFICDVPPAISNLAAKIRKFEGDHFVKFGRYPSDESLIEEFRIDADGLLLIRELHEGSVPFDMPIAGTDLLFSEQYLDPDQVSTDRRADARSQWAAFMAALRQFSEVNQKIIIYSFGILGKQKLPVADIAQMVGLSEGRVNKRRDSILLKLREMMQGGTLDRITIDMPEATVHRTRASK
jgi:RNA polymerase primary sigma factor